MSFYKKIKRLIDVIFSFVLIVVLSPFFVFIMIIFYLDLKTYPFFFQERAGLYGKKFNVIKLKTMSDLRDENGQPLPDDIRLTKLGRLARKLSIDELPQLINVFKGDMSFIGPRPFIYEYMHVYTDTEKRRHDVRPGVSGWAQVNGRNSISWKEKFKLDLYYVDNISLYIDIKILFLTLLKVFKTSDINQKSNMTMEKYNGKN